MIEDEFVSKASMLAKKFENIGGVSLNRTFVSGKVS